MARAAMIQHERTVPTGSWWSRHSRQLAPYLFLAPFLALFAVFLIYPVIDSLRLSLYDAKGLSDREFIGLKNYQSLATDDRFRRALVNTCYFALGTVCVQLPLALLLALALNSQRLRLRNVYRFGFFVPYVTSAVVVSFMFILVFDKNYGLLNNALAAISVPKLPWLTSTQWAMPALIILGLWTWVGINSLYFHAGLQGISPELIEAARIDGASPLQIFARIILPLLRPVTVFVFTIGVIGSFHLFAQPYLLTQGGPQDSTLTLTMYLYQKGFRSFDLGYAAAIGYAIVLITGAVALLQIRLIGGVKED